MTILRSSFHKVVGFERQFPMHNGYFGAGMRNRTSPRNRFAFTLVELLVVIGIIALLVAILLPSLNKARQQALLTQCQAQMRDFGNAITMYTIDNKGYFPGPMLGQIRSGYQAGTPVLGTFIAPYLKLPTATANWQPIKTLMCPGYLAANPGIHDEASLWTYCQATYDPYPWFGYPVSTGTGCPFPVRVARFGTVKIVAADGSSSQQVGPMKASQVFNPAQMPLFSDFDNAAIVYASGANQGTGEAFLALNKVPNHGGRPETRQGVAELASGGAQNPSAIPNGPFYNYVDKTAATNPPRNYLFVDGHVQTYWKSDPILPPQLTTKFGPKPINWFIPVLN
jgi:prepilin-type N-terminal cleavage/methylation domain-containing protein/prepilin-type processing-associated H-X9-DG protein